MVRVHVLDKYACQFWRASTYNWYPVYLNRQLLKECGLTFRFFEHECGALCDSDIVFVSCRYFEGSSRESRVECCSRLRARANRLVWLDFADSSGNCQFDVLPYVDKYLRKQLLVDRKQYRIPFPMNRIYCEYYRTKFGASFSDCTEETQLLPSGQEHKLGLCWNLGMYPYRPGNHGDLRYLAFIVREQLERYWGVQHAFPYLGNPSSDRRISLLGRYGTPVQSAIMLQRRKAIEILHGMHLADADIGIDKCSKREYVNRLLGSKLVLSLFGWGEVCLREFEAFLAGAAVMQPDMSHLETWPDYYIPGETYWPLKWDLSDLGVACERLLSDDGLRVSLAVAGQRRFVAQWGREGRESFCERLRGIVDGILAPVPRLSVGSHAR